jgi:hypothetical protein
LENIRGSSNNNIISFEMMKNKLNMKELTLKAWVYRMGRTEKSGESGATASQCATLSSKKYSIIEKVDV